MAAADGDLALLSSLTAPTSGGIIYYDYHSDDDTFTNAKLVLAIPLYLIVTQLMLFQVC